MIKIVKMVGGEGEEVNLICSHVGLGASILIGLAASEISGAITIIALPITTLIISLSGNYYYYYY